MFFVKEATGCPFDESYLLKMDHTFSIADFGAGEDKTAVENTRAINRAIKTANITGGTVIVPKGDYKVYTIRLMSNVNLYLSEGSTLCAAKTDIKSSYEIQIGEGGNYDEPEVNLYVGLQDHGHTYFANSLIYGADISNVLIYGKGLINGSALNDEGKLENVLMGGDPAEPCSRRGVGHQGEWFGNKAISLVRCHNIGLCDFTIIAGGHFAIIAICVKNMYVNGILLDTNRDAFDVDCCQNVTIRNSIFNSLTDDALVMKASYGGGIFMPLKNVLIEDCKVSGYDMGSVYNRTYTKDKLIATDRCGPTARVKLGTESTCGYDIVTIRRVEFKRSRGFALEAVDGSDLSNIIFEDSTMEDVSSSPIFIKVGDRARYPVTGDSQNEDISGTETGKTNVRLDNTNWILPNKSEYTSYPAKRYTPSYNRSKKVTIDGHSSFYVVDQEQPCKLNPANYYEIDGKYYEYSYNTRSMDYEANFDKEIKRSDLYHYGNASGSDRIAKVYNIVIRNIDIKNADPRYPMELMGLMGSSIENVTMENIQVVYRGGLSLEHAVEQRQLNSNWEYTENGNGKKKIQSLPWLVNTFFLKNEGLLARVSYDIVKKKWKEDPFNIPELPEVYPEPSNWGILPAYGLYARHVKGLFLKDITMSYMKEDARYPIVLDDVDTVHLDNINVMKSKNIEDVVCVSNEYKRPAGFEYVANYPYTKTSVSNLILDDRLIKKDILVQAPAPGTPKDDLYSYETLPIPENGYEYSVDTKDYPLPETVYRPFFLPVKEQVIRAGETLRFPVTVRQPAYEVTKKETDGKIYNETVSVRDYTVSGIKKALKVTTNNIPEDAEFDTCNFEVGKPCFFTWTPDKGMKGKRKKITFISNDGIIEDSMIVTIQVI